MRVTHFFWMFVIALLAIWTANHVKQVGNIVG